MKRISIAEKETAIQRGMIDYELPRHFLTGHRGYYPELAR